MSIIEQTKELYANLAQTQQTLLGQLMADPNAETWYNARKIIISAAPLITLEMAVKRVRNDSVNTIPDLFTLYRALGYAKERSEIYASLLNENTQKAS
ncbi:MAG: hypothetical protein OEY38_04680 [Gammaproteobacteria bacterium]|nr:hypothetical protein [Gammaproteobacteria bacterium]